MPAVAGHGALVAVQLTPGGAWTTIAQLSEDINWPELSRTMTESSVHQDNIDSHVGGIMRRGMLTFGVNYIYDDPTHDNTTGVLALIQANTKTGWRITGPQGGIDVMIASGAVQSISRVAPVRDGVYASSISVQLSGAMSINGVAFGVST